MKYFYSLILILLLLINCKKKDSREALIGTYNCIDNNTIKVSFDEKDQPNSIILETYNFNTFQVQLSNQNQFNAFGSNTPYGYFSNDTLYYMQNICIKKD